VRTPVLRAVALGPDAIAGSRARRRDGTLRTVRDVAIATLIAVGLTAIFLALLGADPVEALGGMVDGALGDRAALGQTLLATTPLVLTGLAAAVPLSARVFNVGAEGQLIAGAVAAAAAAFWLPQVQPGMLVVLCMLAGIAGGGLWGLVPGVLKARTGANEVIVTLMLNFVAALLAAYVIAGPWSDPIAPQTRPLPAGVELPALIGGTAAKVGVLIAVAAAVLAFLILRRTRLGFAIRATGMNPSAARLGGFRIEHLTVVVLVLAGAFAGLAGAIEVVGNHQALVNGIASTYGFNGIAVALVARLLPLAIVPIAFLFAAVTVGANTLPATTGVSTAASLLVLAVFVLALLGLRVIRVTYPEVR